MKLYQHNNAYFHCFDNDECNGWWKYVYCFNTSLNRCRRPTKKKIEEKNETIPT